MKKLILFSAVAIVTLGTAQKVEAQIRLDVFGGYTFQDQFDINGYYNGYTYQQGQIDAGAHFGAALEFLLDRNTAVELYGQYQPTNGSLQTSLREYGPYDVDMTYIMIGGMRYAPISPMLSGYGGLSIGAAILGGEANASKFAWGGKLGLMFNFTDQVGLKIGAQFLSPVQGTSGGFYYGTGGLGAGVNTYSSIYQFGLTGGLCYTFTDKADRPASQGVTY